MNQPNSFSHEWWRTVLIVVLLLALWEIGVRVSAQWSDTNVQNILPGPSKVILTGWQMLTSGQLVSHTLSSLGRVVAGYLIAAVVGVVLGVAAFQSPIAGAGIEPIAIGLRAVPPFAWIPLILLWLGVRPSD